MNIRMFEYLSQPYYKLYQQFPYQHTRSYYELTQLTSLDLNDTLLFTVRDGQ